MSDKKYDAGSITVLEGLKAIQKRPGMYIGDLSEAFRHMIREVIDNSIDEFISGFCKNIYIKIEDNICSVEDDGRGIPVDMHSSGKSALEVILTTLHSGGKFSDETYKYSAGLHGVGLCAVSALSEFLEVEVYRDGKVHFIRLEYGEVTQPTHVIGTTTKRGTKLTFKPDFKIIEEYELNVNALLGKLDEIALLNPGLHMTFEYNGEKKVFASKGIKEFVAPKIFHTPIFVNEERVSCAFGFGKNFSENIMCFTNNVKQSEGGTHLSGFKIALTRSIKSYIENNVKSKVTVQGEDIHASVVAILSVKIQEPQFASQTKSKLVSREAKALTENAIFEHLSKWLEENPKEAIEISKHIIMIAERREAIQKTKDSFKKLDENPTFLAGKLVDCRSENPVERELFLVEGDSAGGSACSHRDGETQAVLPMKGKIINVFRHNIDKVLDNVEIRSLISAIGTGIFDDFNYEKLRYHKIIIMTDADYDGRHIFTLLMTCFMYFMPELLKKGHVFCACPPLYKVTADRKVLYIQDNQSLDKFLAERLIAKYGLNMKFETLVYYLNECKKFNNKLMNVQSIGMINKQVFSLAYTYNVFENKEKFIKMCEKVFDCKCKVDFIGETAHVNINSIFENVTYVVPKENIKIPFEFPINFGEKTIYEPIEFLEFVNKKINEGVDLQRYKGLGEMNPDELYETTLDTSKRIMKQLIIQEEEFEDVKRVFTEIMNDENDRREFVLRQLDPLIARLNLKPIFADHAESVLLNIVEEEKIAKEN